MYYCSPGRARGLILGKNTLHYPKYENVNSMLYSIFTNEQEQGKKLNFSVAAIL